MNNLEDRLKEISNNKNTCLYPKFPTKNLLIEVTNSCNCNCIFCANSKMQRKRGFIDPKLVYKVLTEAYQLGVREVGFYTTGESLLDENLSEYIKLAKKIGYNYTYITTNAILLDEVKIKELTKSGIDSIKLSINAINRSDYEFIHGVDKFDIVIKNLKFLYDYRKKFRLNYRIFVSYIATRYTDYDIDVIKKTFEDFCDEVAIVNVRNQSGMMPEINNHLACECLENKFPAERTIPCHYVFNTLNVTCEGYLTACCTDFENYLAYADLNKVSLKDGWHNDIITKLRQKHLSNDLENTLCDNCINSIKRIPTPLDKNLCTIMEYDSISKDKAYKRIVKYKLGRKI